jgi:hypothetical protein
MDSSLFTSDLSAITVWKQKPHMMHFQPTLVGGGSSYHGSSTRRTNTGIRPGAQCPGGAGVEVKHNSYQRHLNRITGVALIKRACCPLGPLKGAHAPLGPLKGPLDPPLKK